MMSGKRQVALIGAVVRVGSGVRLGCASDAERPAATEIFSAQVDPGKGRWLRLERSRRAARRHLLPCRWHSQGTPSTDAARHPTASSDHAADFANRRT